MTQYWQVLTLLQIPVILGGFFAWKEGWLGGWQVQDLPVVPPKYLTYLGHGGVVGLVPLNFVLADIVSKYAATWSPLTLVKVLLVVIVPCYLMVAGWTQDDVPAALVRNRMPTVPGIANYTSFVISATFVVMFFLFTPHPDLGYALFVTVALMIYVAAGILQPPFVVHGSIHAQAWLITLVEWVVVISAYLRLKGTF